MFNQQSGRYKLNTKGSRKNINFNLENKDILGNVM